MSINRVIVERGKQDVKAIDKILKNKWNWNWLERSVAGTFLDHCIRKLDTPGMAFCIWCASDIPAEDGKLLKSIAPLRNMKTT